MPGFLEHLAGEYAIDPDRISVTGLSIVGMHGNLVSACENCFATFVLRGCVPDRGCIMAVEDDGRPEGETTLLVRYAGHQAQVVVTDENRELPISYALRLIRHAAVGRQCFKHRGELIWRATIDPKYLA